MSYAVVVGDLEQDMNLTASVGGSPINLTTASAIEMSWKKPDGTTTTVPLGPVALATGQVKRVWEAGDTDMAGVHRGRIVITWATGEVQTVPNDGSWFIWHVYE